MIKVICGDETREIFAQTGENLLSVLQRNGYDVSADCGGVGKCGKCKVEIETDGKKSVVFACKTGVVENMTIVVGNSQGSGLATEGEMVSTDKERGTGLALDVGTTTLAFYFVDLFTGETIKTVTCLNPQRPFGADVVSRIAYAIKNGVGALHGAIKVKVNSVIADFTSEYGKKIKRLMVTGNTVMQHVFVGEDIASFGAYPFSPIFLESREYGRELGYDVDKVVLLPSFSSFVGADIVCGGIAVNVESGVNILVDLGTNGEMLCHAGGKLYSTSVAAGPAFEGADIECGMGGIAGAICSVECVGETLKIKTVDDALPKGVCGSGLVDAISVMLKLGVIDETGAFLCDKGRFYLSDDVYISAEDVRKFQLAKSAVRSGLEVLLKKIEGQEVEKLYVCGGLGYYINIDNAVNVGLFPEWIKSKTIVAGNTAGIGAKRCLLRKSALYHAKTLALQAENVQLSTDEYFSLQFMENMFF